MCRVAGDAYGVRYSRTGLVVWASKLSVAGLRVWASKPGRRFPRRNGWHVAASGSSRRDKATDEETWWPSDEDETGLDHNALGLSGLTQWYLGEKLGLCNSPVK
jgi:hypothetical protein